MIKNYDSDVILQIGRKAVISKGGALTMRMNLPVILVSPETMDTISPPNSKKCINEESLIHTLDRFMKSERRWDEYNWDLELAECYGRCNNVTIALGAYARSTEIHRSPAIYLCPERIENAVGGGKKALNEVGTFVYLHELTHAFLDVGRPHPKVSGQILEEAIANGTALSVYSGRTGAIEKLVEKQPLEYRAGWFFAREKADTILLSQFKLSKMGKSRNWQTYEDKWIDFLERKRWWRYLHFHLYPVYIEYHTSLIPADALTIAMVLASFTRL